ncbi:cation diffusion facilitator family transporter [Aliiglaciecola sp. LCG003]|uniref:cation diffusion facilitator family transporter n=1 Tax=Aliiglaciecola sp. LCG003 TaxID=3053655 RepID=UPI002573F99E|nr:cation diffusion facilitator family transporter [Aliiglaciecola sp. LCG003]WJG09643.1 cation diffusion facilitator family transporter [Aliiglaciecola sp. LCG003]
MHNHNNQHEHSHHHHAHNTSSKRIGWAFFLNVSFTIIEFIGGWLTNSTAIMADAVHDLGDSLSIGMAWVLNKLGQKQVSSNFTYGYKRLSLLGALINSVVLIFGSAWVLFEAVPRLAEPQMPHTEGMLLMAIFGMAVNGFAAYKLSGGETLNERVLNWHLFEDVLGWAAVFIVSVVLMFADWPILDPLLSIGFTLFILFNVMRSLKQTVTLFLQASPDRQTQQTLLDALLKLDKVVDVHHVHFWSLDGQNHVLTAHLVLNDLLDGAQLIALKHEVLISLQPFQLAHTTIEFELPSESCRDAAD